MRIVFYVGAILLVLGGSLSSKCMAQQLSTNYDVIKEFHIQQDTPTGCSLATSLMLIRALYKLKNEPGPFETQIQFRKWLEGQGGSLDYWLRKVKKGGYGVSLDQLRRYLIDTLKKLKIDAKLIRIKRRWTSFNEFKKDLVQANDNDNVIILLNYRAHWSPMGNYDVGRDEILILDVDWDEVYGEEYSYPQGLGEVYYKGSTFHRKWSKRRGYLKITLSN